MAFSVGTNSLSNHDILNEVTEFQILSFYLGITQIPCIINSPLRVDRRPSFGLYSSDGVKIRYRDLSTQDRGNVFDLLEKLWNCSYQDVLFRITTDFDKIKSAVGSVNSPKVTQRIKSLASHKEKVNLECKVRKWETYDIEFWNQFGISTKWLDYADVYPISYKIVVKGSNRFVLRADKLAYAYVEYKEGKVTLKIYQPYNKTGYKWSNKHDSSVISLWTKVPEYGHSICICSSLKDALCLWANTGIPAIAIQGEGYLMSKTAISELKRRYKYVFICLDNDAPGIIDAHKLCEVTGFINVELQQFEGGKDIADLYFYLKDKEKFKSIMLNLFKEKV